MRIVLGIILLSAVSLSATASASNLAVIKINSSENVTFLNHTSDIQGNWIALSGGTDIRIPEIIFNYNGNSTINYTKNGKIINISSPANYEVKYPFTTHQIYGNNSDVNATFYGSSDLSGKVDIYLTKTSPTELRNIAISMIDGDTQPFRDLLSNSLKKLDQPLSGLNAAINWDSLTAGDYVAIVMLNDTNTNNFTIVSATTFQVLEYDMVAEAPSSVQQGDNYDFSASLNAPNGGYTYGASLIHQDSYKTHLKLKSNGTKAGTNLSADGEYLVDAFSIAGVGLDNVNRTTIQNIVEGVIGANNGTVLLKTTGNSTSLSLTTEDLKLGKYILSVGVWSNKSGERLAAFYQKEVEVTPPIPSGATAGGDGGCSASSAELSTNIELWETREGYLQAKIPVIYRFTTPELAVYELVITGNINAGKTCAKVEQLKETSKLVTSPPPGIIYKNVNVWVGTSGFAVPKNIKEAIIIKFRVENSWMMDKVQIRDISLYGWNNGWGKVETKEINRDASYTYFEARTNSISQFAIIAEVPESLSLILPTTPPQPLTPTPVEPRGIWIYVLNAIMIVLAVFYFLAIKKR